MTAHIDWILAPNMGKALVFSGLQMCVKVAGAQTGDAWTLLEYALPPRFAEAPSHRHKAFCEGFYILSGTVMFQIEQRQFQLVPGAMVLVEPGRLHRFWNEEVVPASFLSIVVPAGLERYFEELSHLQQVAQTWPPVDRSAVEDLDAKYGIDASRPSCNGESH